MDMPTVLSIEISVKIFFQKYLQMIYETRQLIFKIYYGLEDKNVEDKKCVKNLKMW